MRRKLRIRWVFDISKVKEPSFFLNRTLLAPPQIFDAHLLENFNLSPSSFHFSVGFLCQDLFWVRWFYSLSERMRFCNKFLTPMSIPKFWQIDLNPNPKFFDKFILIVVRFLLWIASVLREVLWRSGGPGVKSSGLGSFEQFIGQYLFLHLEYKRLAKCIWAGSKFFKQNSK